MNKQYFVQKLSTQVSSEIQFDTVNMGPSRGAEECSATMGYRRCNDFDTGNLPGQDCAGLRAEGNYIAGVVVDGVGQSFYANIAAEELCRFLLEKLWQSRKRPPKEEELSSALRKFARDVDLLVQGYTLPTYLSDLARAADEHKRRRGSQAVFAAFLLNRLGSIVHLYQVGDAGAFIFRITALNSSKHNGLDAGPAQAVRNSGFNCEPSRRSTVVWFAQTDYLRIGLQRLSPIQRSVFERAATKYATSDDAHSSRCTL